MEKVKVGTEDYPIIRHTHKRLFNDAVAKTGVTPRSSDRYGRVALQFDTTFYSWKNAGCPTNITRKLQAGDVLLYCHGLMKVARSGKKQTTICHRDIFKDGIEFCKSGYQVETETVHESSLLIPADKVDEVQEIIKDHYFSYCGEAYWLGYELWYDLSLKVRILEAING
jgi:hypothetical protein